MARQCSNYPNARAGDPNIPAPHKPRGLTPDRAAPAIEPASLPPRRHRTRASPDLAAWCLPRSAIYITVTLTHNLIESEVSFLMQEAAGVIEDTIHHYNEAFTTGNGFNWQEHGHSLAMTNSNGQRLTWGVMAQAMVALYDYMTMGHFGGAVFTIFDGSQEVGRGRII